MLALVILLFGSCARARVQGDFSGSAFGMTSQKGDYIVISQSGGEIMDVWILPDTIVDSASSSDGWIFRDKNENAIAIGGDVKALRIRNKAEFENYHEYHMEFESQTYRELYN